MSDYPSLLLRTRRVLHFTQQQLADFLGIGLRSVQRYEADEGAPYTLRLWKLADAVRPHDPALAAEMDAKRPRPQPPAAPAAATGPLPATPTRAAVTDATLVDVVVCVAAEATCLAPQAVRPALLAAFTRARDLGLSVAAVIDALTPPTPSPAPATAHGAKKSRPARD